MLFGDRRGPNGFGPMTGRGAGFCGGYDRPGYANPVGGRMGYGRGYGRGWYHGGGRGYGRGFGGYATPAYTPAPISKEEEKQFLKNEVSLIEKELDAVRKRLTEIEDAE